VTRTLPIALLAVWLALLAGLPGERRAAAQNGLVLGGAAVRISAGYGGYALPVANSALARDLAARSGLAWQAGFNYSTIPVHVSVEHRQPMARSVRVSVSTPYGYAAEELAQAEQPPAFTPQTTVSHELLVPPSVPVRAVLLPRVCPPSQPGATLKLRVKAEVEGQPPITHSIELTQLEPAHLYSLWLDGPPGQFLQHSLNEDNHLQLMPPVDRAGMPAFEPEVLTSRHYILGVDRRDLTLAPLAARDFAFALADLAQVSLWPETEQQALVAFMLGGGHLCLYGARGSWQGLDLSVGLRPIGRGNLVAVGGGADEARAAINRWLEGELEELTLWLGGSSNGWRTQRLLNAGDLNDQLNLLPLLAADPDEPDVISHRAGYLHPVWIYRETCRGGALEPWDYPEFNTTQDDLAASNRNLRALDDETTEQLMPLQHSVVEARSWPPQLWLLLAGLPLVLLIGGSVARRPWLPAVLAVLALSGGGWLWWQARPLRTPPLRLSLIDSEPGLAWAVEREAQAGRTDRNGVLSLPLPEGALLRRLSWSSPGDWEVSGDRHGSVWHGRQGGPLVTLCAEAARSAPEPPVTVQRSRRDASALELVVDTRQLEGRECYLLTPLGWQVLPGGQETLRLELALPRITLRPGRERLAAWEDCLASWLPRAPHSPSVLERRTVELLRYRAAQDEMPPPAEGPTVAEDRDRLAWLGLLQYPVGLRGGLSGQGVLLAPLAPDPEGGSETETLQYLRLTFPLEPVP
jgi:hypothetical protein